MGIEEKNLYNEICVPPSLCRELYDRGFNKKCIGFWIEHLNGEDTDFVLNEIDGELYKRIFLPEDFPVLAPTWCQVFEWIQKEYGFYGWVSPLLGSSRKFHYYFIEFKKPFIVYKSDNEGEHKEMRVELLKRLFNVIDNKNKALSLT